MGEAIEDARRADESGNISQNANVVDNGALGVGRTNLGRKFKSQYDISTDENGYTRSSLELVKRS